MKWRQQLLGWSAAILLMMPLNAVVTAQPIESVLITEVQTGSSTSVSEEFIELFNSSAGTIDLAGWKVEYFPASAADFTRPTRTITLSGTVEPESYFILASKDYLTDIADQSYSYVLAKSGGHIRLSRPDAAADDKTVVEDLLGWGTAAQPENEAAPAADGGSSLVRVVDEQGDFRDTDNNKQDFKISANPTPGLPNDYPDESPPANNSGTEIITSPEPKPQETIPPGEVITPSPAADIPFENEQETQLRHIQITELLPNPAAPQTDSEHEYIELYNPNPEPVELDGYKLQSGNNFTYSFTFDDVTMPAGSYQAFTADLTGLTLANSGGRARLLDPNGVLVADTDLYEEAEAGQAWVLLDTNWQWSTTPSPGSANVVTLPAVATAIKKTPALKNSVKTAAKKPSQKAGSSKKTSAAKKTAKSTKPASSSKDRAEYEEPQAVSQVAPLHPSVLAAVGGLALLYGLYEYRQDIANRFYQLRRYRAVRRTAGKPL